VSAEERNGHDRALEFTGLIALAVLLVAVPWTLDEFRQQLGAKYLCFAFPAVGLVLLWAAS